MLIATLSDPKVTEILLKIHYVIRLSLKMLKHNTLNCSISFSMNDNTVFFMNTSEILAY